MAQYVTGASPVTFISENSQTAGLQYQIPLPLISYDSTQAPPNGPVVLSAWTPTGIQASDITMAQTLIQNLINQGILTLSTTPAP